MLRYLFGKESDPVSDNGIKIDFNTVLGTGMYGSIVYKCKRRNEEFAIKRVRLMAANNYSSIVRERDIWQQLNHENVVQLIQHFEGRKDADGVRVIYQLMQLCESDLKKWFATNTTRTLWECGTMINEIISGLSYLHSKNIMHRDLKPQNILISFEGKCKIADFGITVIHYNTELNAHTDSIGTRLYSAPEQFDASVVGEGKYNLKVDVYSLAIILVEFFTVFQNDDQKQLIIKNLRMNARIDDRIFENFGENGNTFYYFEIKNLIELMIKLNPNERPDIDKVQQKFYYINKKAIRILLEKHRIFSQISPLLLWNSHFVFIYFNINNDVILLNNRNTVHEIRINVKFDKTIEEPRIVEELSDQRIISISCGSHHVICLTENNEVLAWGNNSWGQLGNESFKDNNMPTIVEQLKGRNIVSISCGMCHTLALSSDGNVYAWGSNVFAQLGIDSHEDYILTPTLMQTFPENDCHITGISCGHSHSLALTQSGSVYSWGRNHYGQCGHDRSVYRKGVTRVQLENDIVIQKICCARYHSLLLSIDGDVYSFGANDCGQLGRQSDANNRSNAIQIESSVKFFDIYSNFEQNISIGLSETEKCFVWGKCGEEKVHIPRETQFESINETIVFYSNTKTTAKAIIF